MLSFERTGRGRVARPNLTGAAASRSFLMRSGVCVVALLIASGAARATPPLTTVQDILFNADGTQFNGIATLSWSSFEASDMSNVPAGSITTQIVNGLLRVQVVPTANALSPASYTVVYTNANGSQFTENWSVPSSNVAVPVSTIRISSTGTVVGGGGTGGGGGNTGNVTTSITIAQVTGLSSALNLKAPLGSGYAPSRAAVIDASGAIDGASGNLSDCLHVDGGSGPCGSSTSTNSTLIFVDGEVPAGSINGANATFTLANSPLPGTSLALFRNGLLMQPVADYTLSNSTITFVAAEIPQVSDVLVASYRSGTNPPGISFVDWQVPGGAVDGSNRTFTLSQAPNPVESLALYRNGLRLLANLDFTLSGTVITFQPGLAPQPGDVLAAAYRTGGE